MSITTAPQLTEGAPQIDERKVVLAALQSMDSSILEVSDDNECYGYYTDEYIEGFSAVELAHKNDTKENLICIEIVFREYRGETHPEKRINCTIINIPRLFST